MRGYMVTALIAFMIPTLGMATKVGRDEAIAAGQAKQMQEILVLIEKKDRASEKRFEKLAEHLEVGHDETDVLANQVGILESVVSRMEPKLDTVTILLTKYGEDIAVLKAKE